MYSYKKSGREGYVKKTAGKSRVEIYMVTEKIKPGVYI